MQLVAPIRPIETPGHEMRASPLKMKAAWHHLDARRAGHQRIRILDPPETERVHQVLVGIAADPIELEEPIFETRACRGLSRSKLARYRIERQHRLRSCATGGRS